MTARTLIAPNPSPMTLDGTRTYIVGRELPVVIDPGPFHASHLDTILAELGGARPVAILLTHSHSDHAGAAFPLAARTGAPVMMGRGALRPLDGEVSWLAEGASIHSDAGTLAVIATPGHAPEHLSFHWPDGRALFVGDVFMGGAETTLVAPPEGDLGAYLDTLERVAHLAPGTLYPGHGPPLAYTAVGRYRAHRMRRIEQVVSGLAAHGPARPGELLDA
ncbi:MAG TPA: MBL fold metallo-hydrolase, partial [Longimicrobium sp.]|nr:MBL fold metallo-hydrolase [Longimicrobium sp.]